MCLGSATNWIQGGQLFVSAGSCSQVCDHTAACIGINDSCLMFAFMLRQFRDNYICEELAYCYFFSSQVRRSIVYGDQPRNRLDLYLPTNTDGPKPVVVFVTGGAWIIGYKAWGSLLGLQLAERDIIVACVDYRNFPQGTISDMVKDVSQGVSFVCNLIDRFGGDPNSQREHIFLLVFFWSKQSKNLEEKAPPGVSPK
ncbi:hypothetical protein GOBAR_DD28592 [Gossypium barbadense]|nr:hypothetical protein GOBAR_DD28592 [Gossypium barbadense]